MEATPETARVGTRASDLALLQAQEVCAALAAHGIESRLVPLASLGDRRRGSLPALAREAEGVFTGHLEEALRAGQVDLAVHSFKDLPLRLAEGLRVCAVLPREDARDVVVGMPLERLPRGARVGTSSPRRAAYVRARRPDVEVVPVRGNVPHRLERVVAGEVHAVVLAKAGLVRLGREDAIAQELDPEAFPPAPAQGAIAVEGRAGDDPFALAAQALDHPASHRACRAERAVLAALGGGCGLPLGVWATVEGDGRILLRAWAARSDGAKEARARALAADDQEAVGAVVEALRQAGVEAWLDAAR